MLASICRRRRLLVALRQISAGGDGGTENRTLPSPRTFLLSHHYSLTAVAPNSEPCPTTASYLVSCGVSPGTAAAAARRFRIQDMDRADAVCDLLREYGLSNAEVTCLARKLPVLLNFDPDRILRPKLDFLLVSLGFRPHVVASHPDILARSLDKHLAPSVDFLRGILGSDDNLRLAVNRMPGALAADADNRLRPALEALRRHGLSEDSIAKLLLINLGMLRIPIDRLVETFDDLKEIGMCTTHSNFVYAFCVMGRFKRETWQRKIALIGSFGVTEDVVIRAFKMQPNILSLSEETIKEKLRFFLHVLKLGPNSIMQQPTALTLSLDKCVKPRCAVLSLLIREGKLEWKPKLLSLLRCSAKDFSKRFVLKHVSEVPDVVKAFEGKIKFEGFGDGELEHFSS